VVRNPITDNASKKNTDSKIPVATKEAESQQTGLELLESQHNHDDAENELPHLEGARKPTFWDDIRDLVPDWLDEIVAISLLIFGVLSFLALFNSSEALVAVAWSNILTGLFGYGSFLVAAGLFSLGIIILLPKVGLSIRLPMGRILALEIAFLCLLAIFHLIPDDGELRALARSGAGGGILGWGISILPYWLVGRTPSLVLFGIGLAISTGLVAGFHRQQIVNLFQRAGQQLVDWGKQQTVTQADLSQLLNTTQTHGLPESILTQRKYPILRIRANLANLPPSVRQAIQRRERIKAEDVDIESHPLFSKDKRELKIDFNVIGTLTNKKTEDGHRVVRRPDGREKRYFDIKEMEEEKKVVKRDKTLPDLDILSDQPLLLPEENEINHNVVLIENTLLEFDIDIDVVDVQVGPTVTRYAVQPYHRKSDGTTERTRLSKIASFQSDLALALSVKRLRLEIPVPGTTYMGIEVPNKNASLVSLRSVYESKEYYDYYQKKGTPLTVPLGRDVSGNPLPIDLAKMPHLLIAGTTGSGKSVAIAAIAAALLLNNRPDRVKMVMLDPKMVELSRFNGLPHLVGPVETDPERIIGVLKWCTREMDRRYKLLEEHAVRNIDNYNERFGSRRRGRDYMPYIVILIDEIGDLMLSRPEETEHAVTRLAQMARAVGMHLVVATQRPSVDVITGLIKANFPGRIGFSVASGVDSRVILDSTGAEHLLGNGDMLYLAPDASGPRRIQGCYVSDDEVRQIVQHWRDWYEEQIDSGKMEPPQSPWERGLTRREFLAETDPMLEEVIKFVVETQEASASMIQRRMGLGYPRAARLVDMLAELGVVGEPVGGGRARKVLIPKGEDPFKRIVDRKLNEKAARSQTSADESPNEDESF